MLLGARDVTAVVVGSGGLFGTAETWLSGVTKRDSRNDSWNGMLENDRRETSNKAALHDKHQITLP